MCVRSSVHTHTHIYFISKGRRMTVIDEARACYRRMAALWPALKAEARATTYREAVERVAGKLEPVDVKEGTALLFEQATGQFPPMPAEWVGCILTARHRRREAEAEAAPRVPEPEPDPEGIEMIRQLLARLAAEKREPLQAKPEPDEQLAEAVRNAITAGPSAPVVKPVLRDGCKGCGAKVFGAIAVDGRGEFVADVTLDRIESSEGAWRLSGTDRWGRWTVVKSPGHGPRFAAHACKPAEKKEAA